MERKIVMGEDREVSIREGTEKSDDWEIPLFELDSKGGNVTDEDNIISEPFYELVRGMFR